jgi:recombination protein RecT
MSDLRSRARAAAGGNGRTPAAPGTDVDRRPTGKTLESQIQAMQSQFALAMPRGVEATQLVRDALTCLRQTPQLMQCEPMSVLGALMTCAQLGLRPGVLGHAWVLPYWDNRTRKYKAQFILGYQGMVELAHRSGKIASLVGRTVYKNDTFDIEYGLDDNLIHKPSLTDRGEAIGYYAIVKLTTGGRAFWFMSKADCESWRDQYAPRNKRQEIVGPWTDNFDSMAVKTCVRQLAKWMPKSTELSVALVADEGVRVNLDVDLDAAEATYHPTGNEIGGAVVETPPGGVSVSDHLDGKPVQGAVDDEYDPTTEPEWGS